MKPCSDLCHPGAPCWITECGTCDHVLEVIEAFRERSAIMEYDGELNRPIAESLALQEVVRIYGQDAGREVQRWKATRNGGRNAEITRTAEPAATISGIA